MRVVLLVAVLACGDNRRGTPDAPALFREAGVDAGDLGLFGESCVQPPAPTIGICHAGEGACVDEPTGSVCRPFCYLGGVEQCKPRHGIVTVTDRGACVCVPAP